MKKLAAAAIALTAFAAPAHATGTASCRGTINPQIRVDLVIGHMEGPVIAQVRLTDGSTSLQTGEGEAILSQSWIDERSLRFVIASADGSFAPSRLVAWRRSNRGEFTGSLRHGGRTYQVRCRIDEEG